jgi:hypothetical protein
MIRRLNNRMPILVRLSLILLASAVVLIAVTIAKRPLAATLPNHGAGQNAQGLARYQDLLRSRDQAQRAVPQKIDQEVYFNPEVNKNVVTARYLVPGKGEILVAKAEEVLFLKPYRDALEAAEKAIADFRSAYANTNSSKE